MLSAAMCFGTVAIAADTPLAGIGSSAEKQGFDKSMQDLDVKYIEAFNKKDAVNNRGDVLVRCGFGRTFSTDEPFRYGQGGDPERPTGFFEVCCELGVG
jgi:hypothetical protein